MMKRKAGYSARIHVPEDLRATVGRCEVWRSTQTTNPREARLRTSLGQHHFGALFLQLRQTKGMTQLQITALVTAYLQAQLQDIEERLAVNLPGLHEVDRDVWLDGLAESLTTIELQLMHGDYSQTEGEARSLLPHGADVAVAVLSRRLLEARFDALKAELGALHGEPIRHPSASPQAVPVEEPKVSPRVSEVFREYITTTGTAQQWAPKTRASRTQAAHLLVDFLDDRPVADITKQDMTAAYLLLPRVPTHYSKRYPRLTPKAAIDAADKANDPDRYSPKSSNLRLEVWRAVFSYATDNDLLAKSPAASLKAFAEGKAQDARDAFNHEQMVAFFALLTAEKGDRPEHYWIARVMAFTGLRLEGSISTAAYRCSRR